MLSATAGIRAQPSASPAANLWNAVPDEDLIVSVNVGRIIAEAMPRILGEDAGAKKDFEKCIAEIRAQTGLDGRRVTRAVVGAQIGGSRLDAYVQVIVIG